MKQKIATIIPDYSDLTDEDAIIVNYPKAIEAMQLHGADVDLLTPLDAECQSEVALDFGDGELVTVPRAIRYWTEAERLL